jgi:S1-C subfamily serine protease
MSYSDFVRACARRLAAVVFISMSLAAARAAHEHADAAEPVADAAAVARPSSVPVDVANAVVKVFSTMRYPDPSRPWIKQAPSEVTASGVVIDGKRILTNAHVVLFASQVQVQANQAGDKI